MNQYNIMSELYNNNCDIEQAITIIDSLIIDEDRMPSSLRSAILFMVKTGMELLNKQAQLVEELHTAYFEKQEKNCKLGNE